VNHGLCILFLFSFGCSHKRLLTILFKINGLNRKFGDNVIEEIHVKGENDHPHDVEVIMKNLSAMNSVLQNQRETTLAIKGMPKILAQRKLVRNKSYFGF